MNKTSEKRIRVRSVRCKVSHKDYQENIKDNPISFQKKHSYYYLLQKYNVTFCLDNNNKVVL